MRTVVCVFVGSVLLGSLAVAAGQPAQKTKQNQAADESMSADMREAIAFERAKDRADARQAALEAKHPTVFYNQAERDQAAQEGSAPGKKVPATGPAVKK
jgi:hypothetical protein